MMVTEEHEGREDLLRKRAIVIGLQRSLFVAAVVWSLLVLTLIGWAIYVSDSQRALLIDCTSPAGECFQQGQKRTAAAVQALIDDNLLQEVATRRVVVLAAQCANEAGTQTTEEIEQCVERGLRNAKQKGGSN